MIVVVEGPTAAGKAAWCREHFPDGHVPEPLPPPRAGRSSLALFDAVVSSLPLR